MVNEALKVYYGTLLFILYSCGSCHSAEKASDGFEPWGWDRCAKSATSLVQTIPFLAWLLFSLLLLLSGPLTRVIFFFSHWVKPHYFSAQNPPYSALRRSYINLEPPHFSDFISHFASVVSNCLGADQIALFSCLQFLITYYNIPWVSWGCQNKVP